MDETTLLHCTNSNNEERLIETIENFSFEIRSSKTGLTIPVVNGVPLHSIYNPLKEAETFIQVNMNNLTGKKNILILGLGFGYHVNQAIHELRKHQDNHFKILIIEPNIKVYNEYIKTLSNIPEGMTILAGRTATALYNDSFFIDFLLKSPSVIPHSASFNLYHEYFKTVITYKAPLDPNSWGKIIQNPSLHTYLKKFNHLSDFSSVIDTIKSQKQIEDELDFLLLSLSSFTNENHSYQSGDAL